MDSNSGLDAIFQPGSVALIGASGTPGKLGYDILYNLIHAGFEGPIFPINPKADQLLGLTAFKDIGSTPSPADLAVIVIPSRMVNDAVEQCGKAGVKAAIIVTGGFAEAGHEGELLQEELARTGRKYGVRLIGPNCQGVNSPHHKLCASWPLLTTRGGMAFIAQSGTVGAALMDWASEEEIGVSVFVSLGNRADVDESDCINYFNRDPNTRVISLYVEGVKRPAAFMQALAEARKPVVVLKSGRTARGRVAAESHTKSMAGSDEIYNAIFSRFRVHRADTLEELYDFSKALAYMKKPPGKRLLHISSSGGAAILAIDEADKLGFVSPAPGAALVERLRRFLPAHCGTSNPIDLTGDAITDPSLYSKVIAEAKSEFDASVVIFGDPIHGASDIVTGENEVIVFCGGADVEREESRLMHRKGIPVYRTPERGIKALYQFFRFDEETKAAQPAHDSAAAQAARLMPAPEAVELLKKFRIPAVEAPLASTPAAAVSLARKFAAPVALKISSPDVSHKSDVGGVRLGLAKPAEIREAFEDIVKKTKSRVRRARVDGVTVSPMAPAGGLEVILGVIRDPQYGPALMFGLGGIFTEIYRDVQFCLLPAADGEFLRVIRGIRCYPLIAGARGRKPKDEKALLRLMKAVSRLVEKRPDLDQIDLNPVIVYEKGLSVVDCRILLK
ncbi:MAG: acetate--CoA ligase family protein, partial [Syntrophales bacterium]